MPRHVFLLLCFLLVPLAVGAGPIWPDDDGDLPRDPAIRYGELPNGLRYAIRPNAEPRNRASLRFVVAAGSLHERDDERGLAHFVEHMAFRGTRRHPNGSLATELQRRGIAFGPDNTAFTRLDNTIYHLELPDTTEATLRLGLSVFREYAEDVTFAPELIERERGVILAEKEATDTPDARAGQFDFAFLWPESRQAQRQPIGTVESIRRLAREQFLAFYDAWYRPERMAVVVVGDIEPDAVERLLREALAPIAARGPPRDDGLDFTPASASRPNIAIFSDPGLVGAGCVLQHPFRDPREPDTHARRVAQLHRALAFAMLQRRAEKAAARTNGQPLSPSANVHAAAPGWALATFGGTGKIVDWEAFMTGLEQEHRRAFLHGFTDEELRSVRRAFATSYEEAVRTAATWPSEWIAQQLSLALVEGERISTPANVQADMVPALEAATTADCLAAFRAAWSTASPHVFIATHPDFNVTTTEVAAALNLSRTQAVAPPAETPPGEFGYTDFGPAGALARETHLADLDVHQAEFANGVRLNFKATPFDADSVTVCVRVGTGQLSQPAQLGGLDLLANHLVPRGGLGRHTFDELQDILNGHRIRATFTVQGDAFEFTARCAPGELALCLQVVAAHLTDSALRPEAMRHVHAMFGSMYAGLGAASNGPIRVYAPRILAGGDRRFGIPPGDELMQRTIEELTQWIGPEFRHGAIELSVAGDTTWAEATAAVSRTLGALPPRTAAPNPAVRGGGVRVASPRKPMYVYTTAPQLQQVAITWFCPVRDLGGIRQERRCVLLAELVEERMRVRLRDELGATYHCSAHFVEHPGFPEFNYFTLFAEVSPAHAEAAARVIRDELEALRKKRFTDDEFERVKAPFLRRREEDLRSNAYWGYTVLRDCQQRPERLAAARDRASDTAAITRRELEKLARRYFKPKQCFQFVAYPSPNRTTP